MGRKKANTEELLGDNKPPVSVTGSVVLQYVERAERLAEEAKSIKGDIKELFVEAKGNGFDVSILREIIKRRKQDRTALEAREELIEVYMSAMRRAQAGDETED